MHRCFYFGVGVGVKIFYVVILFHEVIQGVFFQRGYSISLKGLFCWGGYSISWHRLRIFWESRTHCYTLVKSYSLSPMELAPYARVIRCPGKSPRSHFTISCYLKRSIWYEWFCLNFRKIWSEHLKPVRKLIGSVRDF